MHSYVYIDTFGCSANQNNSEILAGLLAQSGFQLTNNSDIADIHIVNTCVVKNKTVNKIKRKIQDLNETNKLTIITGCMPNAEPDNIKKLNNKALLLGTNQINGIVKLIKNHSSGLTIANQINQFSNYLTNENEEKVLLPKIPQNPLISITQISEGCMSKCTFCKTKNAKGNLFSYPQDKIIRSIENDLSNGAKEVWITSQGNACYGTERGKKELPELLNKIINLKHNFKLRLGMMNPQHIYPILEELIEIYKHKKMYKFLHIPIQSASNKVLNNMKRPYTIERVIDIINKFKKEFPDIVISTDVITGYPTENTDDHEDTINFIKKIKPDVFNLSKFSKHKYTEANKLTELSIETINQRNIELMRIHKQTAYDNKLKFLNKKLKVFVNKKTGLENIYEARDDNYNIVLIKSGNKNILGKNLNVRIGKVGVHHLIGDLLT